ncbi:MAG: hypothetical protein ACFWTZ_08775 [Burkholderia sp.]|jgi:hypothetical protein
MNRRSAAKCLAAAALSPLAARAAGTSGRVLAAPAAKNSSPTVPGARIGINGRRYSADGAYLGRQDANGRVYDSSGRYAGQKSSPGYVKDAVTGQTKVSPLSERNRPPVSPAKK